MAQDNACIMYGILTSPACGGDPPVILSPGGAEMACRMVFVAWLAFGVISIGIGSGSSGISGMIIGRRGRVVWLGRGLSRSRIFRQPAAARNTISACGALGSPAAVADQKKTRMKGHELRRYAVRAAAAALPIRARSICGGLRVERADMSLRYYCHVLLLLISV
jgi:hypothetical protein